MHIVTKSLKVEHGSIKSWIVSFTRTCDIVHSSKIRLKLKVEDALHRIIIIEDHKLHETKPKENGKKRK